MTLRLTSDRSSPRDLAVVRSVTAFRHLTAGQIQQFHFAGLSAKPLYRALRRLTAAEYLTRLPFRHIGLPDTHGEYAYALDRRGTWYTGVRYDKRSYIGHHLAVADCVVVFKQAEAQGNLRILGFSTEPDCHVTIGAIQLKPDLYIEIELPNGERLKLWLEMDMATEGQRQVSVQLDAYWKASSSAYVRRGGLVTLAEDWPAHLRTVDTNGNPVLDLDDGLPVIEFPGVVWVAVDAERAKELAWLIGRGPAEAQELFKVATRQTLAGLLQRLSTGIGANKP